MATSSGSTAWLLAASSLACELDTSGIGHASGLGSMGPESSSGPVESSSAGTTMPSTTDGTSGEGTSATTQGHELTGEPEESSASSSEAGVPDSSSTTEPLDPCAANPSFEVTIEAADAVLTGTMMLGMLGNGQQYVYSANADTGTASFAFHTECPGTYAIWAHVYDANPQFLDPLDDGAGADRVRVDVESDQTDWRYGCQTELLPWSWQAIGSNDGLCLSDMRREYVLGADDHTVVFTPLEAGTPGEATPGEAAAIMRVIVTNDLDFSP